VGVILEQEIEDRVFLVARLPGEVRGDDGADAREVNIGWRKRRCSL
jgi:hypothetical protein